MGMRQATTADIQRMAEIAAIAFDQEPLQYYRFPHRHEHWQGWVDFWYYLIQRYILEPGSLFFVWEEPVDGRAQIVAVCGWQLMPYGPAYTNAAGLPLEKDAWTDGLWRRLAAYRKTIYRTFVKDRAKADDSVFADFANIINTCMKDHWTDPATGQMELHWHLVFPATLPEHQKKGYGTKLARWGVEQADKDGLPLGVNASPRAMCLYGPLGFEAAGPIVLPDGNGLVCKRPAKKTVEGGDKDS